MSDPHGDHDGGAMPMPHGSDDAAPAPEQDAALPMPHGSDDAAPLPEQDGAMTMPHDGAPADDHS